MATRTDFALSILNGVVGQHLQRTRNPLATTMGFVREGRSLPVSTDALLGAYPAPSPRVVVLVHGLMGLESHFRLPDGTDYGSLLARDFSMTPLYVRYNSGQTLVDSGAQLSALLGRLVAAYPVPLEELVLIGHSMGGLVLRAACHASFVEAAARGEDAGWLRLVKKAFYLGTPHGGAPLERAGRVVTRVLRAIDDPYTRLVADVADLRSDGIKNLGDARHPVPLLPSITHYLVAGTMSAHPLLAETLGDSLVPVSSATLGAVRPEHAHVLVGVSHNQLARHPRVYEQLHAWLAA